MEGTSSTLGGDKRPAPPNSPTLEPSTSINPNHPAVLGLSGSAKKKPPPFGNLGMSTANGTTNGTAPGTGTGTGSFFGGVTSASPPAIAGSTATPSTFAGFGG